MLTTRDYATMNAERIARMNRAIFLVGQLLPVELDGAIVLLEAVLRDRRCVVGMTPTRAAEGVAFLLPDGAW